MISILFLLSFISFIGSTAGVTNTYTIPGNYSLSIPPTGVNSTTIVTLWGAGGAGTGIGSWSNPSALYPGGSGAYVSCEVDAPNGAILYLVVGEGGRVARYGVWASTAKGGGGRMSYKQIKYIQVLFSNFT